MKPKKLTRDAFGAARDFLMRSSRPLEYARFRCAFERAAPHEAIEELLAFRCDDGGFGYALEPDLRTPESSALAVAGALQIVREISDVSRTPSSDLLPEPTRADLLSWLERTFDVSTETWAIIPPFDAGIPHAPWWNPDGVAERFDFYVLNPTAELAGFYTDLAPADWVSQLFVTIRDRLAERDEIDMHELLSVKRLAETGSMPEALRLELIAEIRRLLPGCVVTDPDRWGEYCLRPVDVADSSDSPFLADIGSQVVAANLDRVIDEQSGDGSWQPVWSWDDAFPDEWATARQEWAGVLTLSRLRLLSQFGRVDPGL